jgi:hypothetical protein
MSASAAKTWKTSLSSGVVGRMGRDPTIEG